MCSKTYILLLGFFICQLKLNAQDLPYTKGICKMLCSDEFSGRGYVNDGDGLAAQFIRTQMKEIGLKPMADNYFQKFGFEVVCYPDRVQLNIDGKDLIPGKDFIINPGCPRVNGKFSTLKIDSALLDNTNQFNLLFRAQTRNFFLVVDHVKDLKLLHPERIDAILKNQVHAKGLLYCQKEKLTWGVAQHFADFPIISILASVLPNHPLSIELKVDAEFKLHQTQNILGKITGKKYPDSVIVVSAHYDHLGMMGSYAKFPGANDNASGVAMMLDLAKHFSKKGSDYTLLFIAFAAEEAGLLGSLYYTENPIVPLKQIKLLLNLDLMSTGDKGMMVVNGTEFPDLFDQLKFQNSIGSYLPSIQARGKAANSDHYYFSEKGVKALFFYLMGEYHAYHDVEDDYEALTYSKYNESFELIADFIASF